MTGFKHSEITLEKMRIVQSQRSDETKKKLSISKMGHYVSNETKSKIGFKNRIVRRIKKQAVLMWQDEWYRTLYV